MCTSPSRFPVDRRVYDAFTEAFVAAMAAIKVGNGLEPGVQMGPMVSHRRLAAVQKLIEDAVSAGAQVAAGGKPIGGKGYFYQPTVLTDVPASAAILHDEPFGPVAPVATFDDLDEAIEDANSLPYGLAAYAYTDSAATAEKLIAGYEAGILSINHCGGSVPQAPSGGFKESGYDEPRHCGAEKLGGVMSKKPAYIHHVNFPTTSPERTIEWYSKVFGMKYIRPKSNTKVVLMTTGAFDLHFTPVEEMDRMAPYHFAMEVEDWEGFLAHLDELGIRHTRVITRPENNSQFCYIHDPDHTMIELVFHTRRPYPPVPQKSEAAAPAKGAADGAAGGAAAGAAAGAAEGGAISAEEARDELASLEGR